MGRPKNLFTLAEILPIAEKGGYAVGSFSPRTTVMVRPVLQAGQKTHSPLIIQISEKEFDRFGVMPAEFADELFQEIQAGGITVPVVLHLDHTRSIPVIKAAIAAGFTSVMIDASEKELEDNIAISKEVAEYAHARGVSVEAELGRIGTTDFVETEQDEEYFTNPQEALRFVNETKVDALAVSVGTAHGVYLVRQPHIDYARLQAIRALTPVHMVIHGGSGIPSEMLKRSFELPGGGVSKVNIATDLELAAIGVLGREKYLTNREWLTLPVIELEKARQAVEALVTEKINSFVFSAGRSPEFGELLK